MILTTILVPFFPKRVAFEFLTMTALLSFYSLWGGWDMPTAHTVNIMTDKLSTILMMLSLWMAILMTSLKPADKFLSLNMILLLWSLLAFFSVSSILMFFVMFEASLIPTLLLVLGWGYQPERLQASFYFIFYTILFSIPLLTSLLWMVFKSGSKYFYFDNLYEICSGFLGVLVLCVFLIKLPMFMVHFWLPKAHVEAPVVGSMILAGVLLKTGGYGVVRVFLYMHKTLVELSFMTLGLIGMLYVCFVCLYCSDLKQMIAFSSVSHMNFMIAGLMNNSQITFSGGVMMMVSHGLCSSLMFMLADMSYNRYCSRSTLLNKGLLMSVPCLAAFWGVTVLFNMGIPPSVGSISELLVISGSGKLMMYKLAFSLYLFFSAFYSVYLYMIVNHGNSAIGVFPIKVKEVLLVMAHLAPLASLTLMTKMLLI